MFRLLKTISFFVFPCVLLIGCGTTVQTSNVQTVSINTDTCDNPSQKDAKVCEYLSATYEEFISEMEGIEAVNCCVDYDENGKEFSIKVNITVSAGHEDVIDEIEQALHNEFANIDIQINDE